MYDELVKALRICEDGEHCDLCPKWDDKQNGGMNVCQTAICKEAADAIEELSKPRWIPMTERLPEHLTSVIVHRKDGGIFVWEYFNISPTDECWIDDSMAVYSFYDVTHWMPLPEPPTAEEETRAY